MAQVVSLCQTTGISREVSINPKAPFATVLNFDGRVKVGEAQGLVAAIKQAMAAR
jgi:hypothetical protein